MNPKISLILLVLAFVPFVVNAKSVDGVVEKAKRESAPLETLYAAKLVDQLVNMMENHLDRAVRDISNIEGVTPSHMIQALILAFVPFVVNAKSVDGVVEKAKRQSAPLETLHAAKLVDQLVNMMENHLDRAVRDISNIEGVTPSHMIQALSRVARSSRYHQQQAFLGILSSLFSPIVNTVKSVLGLSDDK
ncbi:hypothetical protein PV328_004683 [Microctonus aethiopoides]|uniref:Uncharacterized protein n=1 Tax=Microctonus aethiopoides TaxID=144406 RepID=A0AA39FB03_9HYME|nr:hypothetical protein PV328_004683 [Microctonus aethiopoides]